MLGLGSIPNRHKKKKSKQKNQAAIRSDASEAQKGPEKKRRRRSKVRSKHVAGSMTPHGDAKTNSRRRPPVHRQRNSGEEKEDMR
jgi:hypothetical protein